jgi:tRNA1Val (adenine37-N6)-methyltransferase
MANNYFSFKQFTINQEKAVFKVGTDGVLLGAMADIKNAKRILDIGTGTGLIAIMAAQRCVAEIIALEPEPNSFLQACGNVKECKWVERINVIQSGLIDFVSSSLDKFDVLISNPPYFKDSLLNPDRDKSSARHSWSLGAEDILNAAVRLLKPDGSLQIIMPYVEGTLFIADAVNYGFYCNRIVKIKGIPTGEIIRLVMKFERVKKNPEEKFLTIETGSRHGYTEEYKEITKDFYLNF